jgi:hypothetical protein
MSTPTLYEHDARVRAANDAEGNDTFTLIDFGDVIRGLKQRRAFGRLGWNRPKQFIFLVQGSQFKVSRDPLLSLLPEGELVDYEAHIDIRTPNGKISVWNPSIRDLIAEDWFEVRGALKPAEAA